MAMGDIIRFRVSETKARIYEAEAEARGVPLGTYIRDRMEEADAARADLATLQATIDDLAASMEELRTREPSSPTEAGEAGETPAGVAIETLLLLRTLAGPEKTKMVTAEVKRLGLATWEGKGAGNASGR